MIDATQDNFDNLSSNGPILVDFYADWCQPCKAIKPYLEDLENDNKNMKFLTVNIEQSPQLAETYGIRSLPTIMLLNGDRQEKSVGLISKGALQNLIDDFLAKN